MQDQNNQPTNSQTQSGDDFYKAVEDVGVTEDQLNLMSAITEAQKESADNSDAILEEMNQTVKDYLADQD